MRRVRITGTPPQDWVDEAEALTQKLRAAHQVSFDAGGCSVPLPLQLTSDADLPTSGTAVIAIGYLKGLLRLRVFGADGSIVADVTESKKEAEHSAVHKMRAFLAPGNWDGSPFKPAEKKELCRIATAIARTAAIESIIEQHEGLWRDDRIRNWLLGQFNNKCWYSEAQDSVSSIHVDHYRPKGRVKQDLGSTTDEGYWWLAFDWKNYRICGQLLNVKKGDLFPTIEGARCTADDLVSLQLEAPALIDPLTDQTRLISYEKDEDACIAVVAGGLGKSDITRAEKTIEIMGMNLRPRLNEKRNEFWDKCMMKIDEYQNASGAEALRLVAQSSARAALKEMIQYNAEFSSVSEACIRKNAPEPLIAAVFDS